MYNTLWQYLSAPVVFFPDPGKEFQLCNELKPISGFFVEGAVGICGYYLDNAEHDMIDLVDTIIHEVAIDIGPI